METAPRWRPGCTVLAIQLALIAATGHAQHDPARSSRVQSGRPIFRSGVELVALTVSVVDAEQRFVSGLGVEDFSVYENGIRRDVALFASAAAPIDVGLLLDVSISMTGRMGVIAEAARGLIRTLRPHDRAAVIGFRERIEVLQPLTADMKQVEAALQRARPHGGTALYDALYVAANEAVRERKQLGEIRRQALVVLSDGQDTSSLMGGDDALAAVRRSGVTVYTISPEPRFRGHSRWDVQTASEAAFLLTTLAQDTGGRAFFLEDLQRLADVYAEHRDRNQPSVPARLRAGPRPMGRQVPATPGARHLAP